jgi:uncharacterized protein (TIGR04255 family)
MPINEIFNNPTVKTVIFQITFPNLFYIEKIIGEYQLKIMKYFPQSSLIFKKDIFLALGSNAPKPTNNEDENARKIWQFASENDVKLSIQTDSLDIVSTHHKTYEMGDGDKFRDIIKFSLDHFLKLVQIPIINRIGLRYIDHCPIINKDNATYSDYYNTCFPLDRFSLEDAQDMDFKTTVKIGNYFLTYRETAQTKDAEFKLILDFDGSANKVNPNNYLTVTDELHRIISNEFEKTAKDSLLQYMRQ